jgi:hypothetical protein
MAVKWKAAALAIAIAGTGIFALSVVSGLLYERAQRVRDRERYPPAGRQIDIGGRMLDVDCEGTGEPTVILESGANWAGGPTVHDPRTMFSNGGTIAPARGGATLVRIRVTADRKLAICTRFSARHESPRLMCWLANHRPL